MKAEEFLTNKSVLNVEWDTDECGEFTLTELLDEYASEVSREVAIEFIKDIDEKSYLLILCDRCKPAFEMLDNEQYESMFDEWMSKQQNK